MTGGGCWQLRLRNKYPGWKPSVRRSPEVLFQPLHGGRRLNPGLRGGGGGGAARAPRVLEQRGSSSLPVPLHDKERPAVARDPGAEALEAGPRGLWVSVPASQGCLRSALPSGAAGPPSTGGWCQTLPSSIAAASTGACTASSGLDVKPGGVGPTTFSTWSAFSERPREPGLGAGWGPQALKHQIRELSCRVGRERFYFFISSSSPPSPSSV